MPLPAPRHPVSSAAALCLSAALVAVVLVTGRPAHAQTAAQRATDAVNAADDLLGGLNRPGAPIVTPSRSPERLIAPNYRDALRDIIATLSDYAKGRAPEFPVLTREGLGLVIKSKRDAAIERLTDPEAAEGQRAVQPVDTPIRRYVQHLDGVVMNDQYCVAAKSGMTASSAFIGMLQSSGLKVLSVDHCDTSKSAVAGWSAARREGVLAHVDGLPADEAEDGLQRVPGGRPLGENSDNVTRLSQARNLLVLDGSAGYTSKDDLVLALADTNYDVIALSPFHRHDDPLTAAQIQALRYKKLGSRRMVLARMDIGHARDTAYYWKSAWKVGDPDWILAPVVADPGLYDVAFWSADWRAILGRTFAGLMDLGFDGVILEGTEAYEPLEAKTPVE